MNWMKSVVSKKTRNLIAISTVSIFTIFLVFGCSSNEPIKEKQPVLNEYGEDYKIQNTAACIMSQQYVKDKIKSPSTAKFQKCITAKHGGVQVVYVGNQTYNTLGYVDTQNSFGAIVRIEYVTQITDNQDETWSLKDMDFWQR